MIILVILKCYTLVTAQPEAEINDLYFSPFPTLMGLNIRFIGDVVNTDLGWDSRPRPRVVSIVSVLVGCHNNTLAWW